MIGSTAAAQLIVTSPASVEVIRAADDFASRTFQDPWDMNQRTDLGWYTFGVDGPQSNLSGISFAGGVFSATSSTNDPNFWLLDTGNPFAANLGKTGKRFPIVSSKYKRLVMRMSLSGAGISNANPGAAQILWSNHTIYGSNVPPGGINTSNAVLTWPGWWIYSLDMQSLGTAVGAGAAWSSADVDSLRIDPLSVAGIKISLDWARLVEDVPGLYRTIQWTGSGAVDIFLDDDTNSANGLHGQIARNVAGNSFSFYVGGLPQGTYRVAICPAGAAGPYSYAPGSWQIQDIPLLTFTLPSPEGSTDDFATTQLNNPWDMDALTDIDYYRYTNGRQITTIAAQSDQGTDLGNVRVYSGTSVASPGTGWGDPHFYPLWYQNRGASVSIDTDRYRILTVEMGVAGDRDINGGSVARIVWQNKGGSENVSDDIILNHLAGVNVIQKLILDMKTLALDPSSATSKAGWTGLVDSLRVDPHEFPDARPFWVKSVKLTALERASTSYAIRWTYTAQGAAGVNLALFYDSTGTGFGGTPIASGLNPSSAAYAWDVAAIPAGTYYIYGVLTVGGSVVNQAYAPWPLVVGLVSLSPPVMSLGRSTLSFGSSANGAIVTGPQEVTVDFKGPGAVTWTVTSNQPWLVVSPASGSGSGHFTVSVNTTGTPAPVSTEGAITVNAVGAARSPLTVRVLLNTLVTGSTAVPFGRFETPADNLVLSGSIAVTGWALDDIEVKQVTIWRDPVGPESTHPNGYVYIGEAMFVPGARPDLEANFPFIPNAYRAGWGYMMLTNALPGKGNGAFTLHALAVDEEGHQVELGTKTIAIDNLHAIKPFGALDTPFPGQTIAGTFVSSGWALTPQPASIPLDGSSIWVAIDGVNIGHPLFGAPRADVASMFSGYANSNSEGGQYTLDTRGYSNSMHTIAWVVYDNQGHGDGIGSRFFNIRNGAAAMSVSAAPTEVPTGAPNEAMAAERAFRLRLARLQSPGTPADSYPAFRLGYDPGAMLTPIRQAGDGLWESIVVNELGRVEIHLPGGQQWTAGLRVGNELRELPIGSTFDAEAAIFYWQPGPAFLNEFVLEFRAGDGTILTLPVCVGAGAAPVAIQ